MCICPHGGSAQWSLVDLVGVPGARPPRVQILSFWHTKFLKCNHLGSPHPPTRSTPPPHGKSWIHHWWCSTIGHPCWNTTVHFQHEGNPCAFASTTIASTNCSKIASFLCSFPPNYLLQPHEQNDGDPIGLSIGTNGEADVLLMVPVPIPTLARWVPFVHFLKKFIFRGFSLKNLPFNAHGCFWTSKLHWNFILHGICLEFYTFHPNRLQINLFSP